MVNYDRKPLDPSLYYLDPRLGELYKKSTGIHDDTQLKDHILRIQREAYNVSSSLPSRLQGGLTIPNLAGFPISLHTSFLLHKVCARFTHHLMGTYIAYNRLGVTECPLYDEVIGQGTGSPDALLLEIGVGCE
jgi:hypothetical protein